MTYQVLTTESIRDYLTTRATLRDLLSPETIETVEEIGDGNLNLIFRVTSTQGSSIILKQALPYVRLVGPSWPMSPQRAIHEGETLLVHARWAANNVPQVYMIDQDLFVLAMEDLSDHAIWRGELNDFKRLDGIADQLGHFMATLAFRTSPLFVPHQDFRQARSCVVNEELCAITEDLVFTEPYLPTARNSVLPENQADLEELADDAQMRQLMAFARWKFLTCTESLIHGDLHTGSIMVRTGEGPGAPPSVKIIDPEFAIYGPVAFDTGTLLANLIFAAARAWALGEHGQMRWCFSLVEDMWSSFEQTLTMLHQDESRETLLAQVSLQQILAQWQSETAVFALAEMCRRLVGIAKVSDIETLDPERRAVVVRALLQSARACAGLDTSTIRIQDLTDRVAHDLMKNHPPKSEFGK